MDKLDEIEHRAEALQQHQHPVAPDLSYLLTRLRAAEGVCGAAQAAHNKLLDVSQITDGERIAKVRELLDVSLTTWQQSR